MWKPSETPRVSVSQLRLRWLADRNPPPLVLEIWVLVCFFAISEDLGGEGRGKSPREVLGAVGRQTARQGRVAGVPGCLVQDEMPLRPGGRISPWRSGETAGNLMAVSFGLFWSAPPFGVLDAEFVPCMSCVNSGDVAVACHDTAWIVRRLRKRQTRTFRQLATAPSRERAWRSL